MKSEQVKFCYAVANGYLDVAQQQLLPQINLWDEDLTTSLTYSPAIICLALASATPEEQRFCLNSLQMLFPQVENPFATTASQELGVQLECKEVVRALVYPPVKHSLVQFLHDSLKNKVKALTTDRITPEASWWIICVFRGLSLILTSPDFADVHPDKKIPVESLLNVLKSYIGKATETLQSFLPSEALSNDITPSDKTPASIQALRNHSALASEKLIASPSSLVVAYGQAKKSYPLHTDWAVEIKVSLDDPFKKGKSLLV